MSTTKETATVMLNDIKGGVGALLNNTTKIQDSLEKLTETVNSLKEELTQLKIQQTTSNIGGTGGETKSRSKKQPVEINKETFCNWSIKQLQENENVFDEHLNADQLKILKEFKDNLPSTMDEDEKKKKYNRYFVNTLLIKDMKTIYIPGMKKKYDEFYA
jgi:hypothetical protein